MGVRIACGVACAWALIGAPPAQASPKDIGTAFPNKVVKLQVEPGKESFKVVWAYINPHELPMLVQEVDSDCGCLAVEVDSIAQVAKGESGKITAKFSPGARRGFLSILLKVRFVGYDKPVELTFEAKIPAPVEASVQELSWTAKNRQQAQTIDVTTGTSEDFRITDLTGLPKGLFIIKQETVKEKRHYRLHITPTGKAGAGVQYLQIHTDASDPNTQIVEVYFRIQ